MTATVAARIGFRVFQNDFAQTASSLDDASRNGRFSFVVTLDGETYRVGTDHDTAEEAATAAIEAAGYQVDRLTRFPDMLPPAPVSPPEAPKPVKARRTASGSRRNVYVLCQRADCAQPWVMDQEPGTLDDARRKIRWQGADRHNFFPARWNAQFDCFVGLNGRTYSVGRGPYAAEAHAAFMARLPRA